MDEEKRKRLAAAGFVSVTVAEFLGLTQAQSDLIEIKLGLTYALRKQRTASGLSQTELAAQIASSQSRIAKMESGDPHVSLDLMIRALLAAGMDRAGLAAVVAGSAIHFPLSTGKSERTAAQGASQPKRTRKRVQVPEAAGV